jgi:hypothetical protein
MKVRIRFGYSTSDLDQDSDPGPRKAFFSTENYVAFEDFNNYVFIYLLNFVDNMQFRF